jgi:hypothetical protein
MRYCKGSRISLILPPFKTVALANSLRGLAQPRKASSLLRRRRGRVHDEASYPDAAIAARR